MPLQGKRTYMGSSVAVIHVVPRKAAKTGASYVWLSVGGAAYMRIRISRNRQFKCRDGFRWDVADLVIGGQSGVSCNGKIRVRTINELQDASSVGRGPKAWSVRVERYGVRLIDRVWISAKSKIGITKATPARLRIAGPKAVRLDDGSVREMPMLVKNIGGRPARKVVVWSGITRDGMSLEAQRRRRVPAIGARSIARLKVPIARLPNGKYRLVVGVESVGSEQSRVYDYEVDEPVGKTERSGIPNAALALMMAGGLSVIVGGLVIGRRQG